MRFHLTTENFSGFLQEARNQSETERQRKATTRSTQDKTRPLRHAAASPENRIPFYFSTFTL